MAKIKEYWRKVKRIIDGDTLEVSRGEKIRILGLNTPEYKQRGYYKAKQDLRSIAIEGSMIKIKKVAKDKYGRTLAYLSNKKGNISSLMKRKGWK